MEVAGFFAEVGLERTSYPEETDTHRASPAGATPNLNQAECGQVMGGPRNDPSQAALTRRTT